MSNTSINEKLCPLCNQPNNCHMHQTEAGECWCIAVTIPQELLDQIPEYLKNKACICKTCVDNFNTKNK
ncbi:cysteine-rich CWC family protein [Planctomycetota bacterium]|nr:cysteine-rich CWC family protein [Planctomycetota bacterium]